MALELSYENAQGVTGNYWKIKSLRFDYSHPEVFLDVELFVSAAARSAGKQPVEVRKYQWIDTDFTGWFDSATLDVVNQNPQERAYVKLKTLPEFSGAVDV